MEFLAHLGKSKQARQERYETIKTLVQQGKKLLHYPIVSERVRNLLLGYIATIGKKKQADARVFVAL